MELLTFQGFHQRSLWPLLYTNSEAIYLRE